MTNQDQILIELNGVSKKFSRNLKLGMKYGLKSVVNTMLGIKEKNSGLRKDEFWAVKDVSFRLKRGECLGLIGRNGAGKSTLMKMLNGLILPDEGSIIMRGRIGALIELGAGFNPMLTGRENIYINGQLLGFAKKEIDLKLDAILEFAEIGEFIDSPVQNYSSGMKVRLGFAIAAQMEPDVLIIDEVLAVGDVGFRIKCYSRILQLLEKAAVIFVSHSMPQIGRICTKGMLMANGKEVCFSDNVPMVVEKYYDNFGRENSNIQGGDKIKMGAITISGVEAKNEIPEIKWLDDLVIVFEFTSSESFGHQLISLVFIDRDQRIVANSISPASPCEADKTYQVKFAYPENEFAPGVYLLTINFLGKIGENHYDTIARYGNYVSFKSVGSEQINSASFHLNGEWTKK